MRFENSVLSRKVCSLALSIALTCSAFFARDWRVSKMRTISSRRLDELGVAYRENVSVPKGSGGAGKVLVCFDEKKYLSDNV